MKTKVTEEVYNGVKFDISQGMLIEEVAEWTQLSKSTINRIKNSKNLEDYFKTQRNQRRGYKSKKAQFPSPSNDPFLELLLQEKENEEKEKKLEEAKAIAVLVKSGFLKVEVNK